MKHQKKTEQDMDNLLNQIEKESINSDCSIHIALTICDLPHTIELIKKEIERADLYMANSSFVENINMMTIHCIMCKEISQF